MPKPLRPALEPLLKTIALMTQSIQEYDRQLVEVLAEESYPETKLLRRVHGIGTLTALTFVLTLESSAARPIASGAVTAARGLVSLRGRPINRWQHRPKGRTSSCTEPRRVVVDSNRVRMEAWAKGELMRCSFHGHHGGLDKHTPSHGSLESSRKLGFRCRGFSATQHLLLT